MTPAEALKLKEPSDYAWVISWRFVLLTPDGLTSQILTCSAPGMQNLFEQSAALGRELWKHAIAPAMTASVTLWYWETMCWNGSIVPATNPDGVSKGLIAGQATGIMDAAVWLLCTGHDDERAVRRMHFPAIRSTQVVGRMLTQSARQAHEGWGRAAVMGMLGMVTGGPLVWLNAYPRELPPSIGNPLGVGFRTVEYVAVCHHTERAPVLSSEPWP